MTQHTYRDQERSRAAAWKSGTAVLSIEARADARYIGKTGAPGTPSYPFCVPGAQATENLLPEVREQALSLFEELGIPWHSGCGVGPGNHLLSSQVQCVNALGQMVHAPGRIKRAFGARLDIADVLEVEPGRHLTFEYIGPEDWFGECPSGVRVRGARCTSVDAAFLYRTSVGRTELALVEWKYTEDYRRRRSPDSEKDAVRHARYFKHWAAADGPLRNDVLSFADLLDEPLYQLMRQQLLAHRLEQERVLGAERVRVVHVLSPDNAAYQQSLVRDSQRVAGATVDEVWERMLRQPDRFVHVDPSRFLDPNITSPGYVARYGRTEPSCFRPNQCRMPS